MASGAMGKGAAAGAEAKVRACSAGCGGRMAKTLFPGAGEGAGVATGTGAVAGEKTGLADAGAVEGRMPVVEAPGLPKGVKVIGAAGDGDADAANIGLAAAGEGAGASAGGAALGGETIIFGIAIAGAGLVKAARAGAGAEAAFS